jgi:hypothetical protein
MGRRCAVVGLLSLAALLHNSAEAAVVIDNLEEGPFSIQWGGTPGWTNGGLDPSNVIRGERESRIEPTDRRSPVSAVLQLGDGDDGVVVTGDPATTSRLQLIYGFLRPLNFNMYATGERYALVRLGEASPGGMLDLHLETRLPGGGTGGIAFEKPVTGPGDYLFPLADVFGGVNPADIDRIAIELYGMPGNYRVDHVALVPEPMGFALFAAAAAAACLKRRHRAA